MTDIIERAEFGLSAVDDYGLIDPLMMATRDLIAELKAERVMRAETQRQLSQFIADFCALRDALPREQVKQILSKAATK